MLGKMKAEERSGDRARTNRAGRFLGMMLLLGMLFPALSWGGAILVTLDTHSLESTSTYQLAFQLVNGSVGDDGAGNPVYDGNTTVRISDLSLGGGTALDPLGIPVSLAPGTLASLTDTNWLVTAGQNFQPGSSLRFTLDISTNGPEAPDMSTPDAFSVMIYKLGSDLTPADVALTHDQSGAVLAVDANPRQIYRLADAEANLLVTELGTNAIPLPTAWHAGALTIAGLALFRALQSRARHVGDE